MTIKAVHPLPNYLQKGHKMKAEILNLSASILLGKATPDQIAHVSKRAKDSSYFEFFKQEIIHLDTIIRPKSHRKETK